MLPPETCGCRSEEYTTFVNMTPYPSTSLTKIQTMRRKLPIAPVGPHSSTQELTVRTLKDEAVRDDRTKIIWRLRGPRNYAFADTTGIHLQNET